MDFNTQDTGSFDSYVSSTLDSMPDTYFTVLGWQDTYQRTFQLTIRYGKDRFVPWTGMILAPSFGIALMTAIFHDSRDNLVSSAVFRTMTAFDEVQAALPLVLWHFVVLGVGALLAQSVIVQFIAEVVYGERLPPTQWRQGLELTVERHAKVLFLALIFIGGSLASVYVVGHVLTVELLRMRKDAQNAKHKDPAIFGFIALAAGLMVLAVDLVVIFCIVWLACLYANLIPVVLLEQPKSPVEVFRIAYVLARDSRSYLTVSWAVACLPGLLATIVLGLPLHVLTRQEGQDFVEWLLGTVAGVIALYLPLLIWVPVVGVHQTILYMTMRVAKDQLTPAMLGEDLDRLAPAYTRLHGDEIPLTHEDADDDDELPEDEFESNGHSADIELSPTKPSNE